MSFETEARREDARNQGNAFEMNYFEVHVCFKDSILYELALFLLCAVCIREIQLPSQTVYFYSWLTAQLNIVFVTIGDIKQYSYWLSTANVFPSTPTNVKRMPPQNSEIWLWFDSFHTNWQFETSKITSERVQSTKRDLMAKSVHICIAFLRICEGAM